MGCWLVGWLVGWSFGWLFLLVGWLVWLVDCLVCLLIDSFGFVFCGLIWSDWLFVFQVLCVRVCACVCLLVLVFGLWLFCLSDCLYD